MDRDQAKGEETEVGRYRHYKGAMARVTSILAISFSLYLLAYVAGVFTDYPHILGFYLYKGRHGAISLCVLLILTFLLIPAGKRAPRDKVPWYDILLILAGLPGCIYIAMNYIEIVTTKSVVTPGELLLGILTMLVLLEAVRRVVNLVLSLIIAFFVFYALYCNFFPGVLWGKGYSLERVIGQSFLFENGIFGMILQLAVVIVAMFIIFAAFLNVSGAGKFFLDLALSLAGRFRGGPAKVAIIASGFFGTLSGSVAANVAGTGMITIPLMKRTGLKPELAGAVESVASVGGMLMPPVMGATAFVMAEVLGVPYVSVCIAAFLPAILYYLAAFMIVDAEIAKQGLKGLPPAELPKLGKTLKEGWQFLLPIVVLVVALLLLHVEAHTACLYALGSLLVAAMLRRETRWSLKKLGGALESGARGMILIGIICASVGMILGSLGVTGMALRLSGILVDLAGGQLLPLLVLGALASILLGMGLPTVACYVLLAVLIAPSLITMGIPPMAAHLFIYYFGLAHFLTPPVCTAVYVATGIAGSDMLRTAFQAMRLGIVIYIVPFLFVYNPSLLLSGSVTEIALAFLTATVGVTLLAAGLARYFIFRKVNFVQSFLLLAAGLLILIPGWLTLTVGVGLVLLVAAWLWLQSKGFHVLGL